MTASLFGAVSGPSVNASGLYGFQSFVGTEGQVLFTLSAFTYIQGTKSLWVFINGQRQDVTRDYSETSITAFTLSEGVHVGDVVDVIGFNVSILSTVPLGLTGTAIFAAGTSIAVVFVSPQPDTNYKVALGALANKTFWVTAKTVAGFTINASSASSDSIDWIIGR